MSSVSLRSVISLRRCVGYELCLIVDVGDVYDPSKHRYDHHQRDFNQPLDAEHTIKLSSAGLVYKNSHLLLSILGVPWVTIFLGTLVAR